MGGRTKIHGFGFPGGREGVWKALAEKGGEKKCGNLQQVPWTNECLVQRVPPWSKLYSDLGSWGRRRILISAFTIWLNLSFLLHFPPCSSLGFLSILCNQEAHIYSWEHSLEYFEIRLTFPEVKHPIPFALLTLLRQQAQCPSLVSWLETVWGVKAYPVFNKQVKPSCPGVGSKQVAGLGWSEVEKAG